jgi:hypothetical protein
MLRLKFWHLIILMIFLPYLLGSKGCGDKPPEPPPPPPVYCGVGTGDFSFNTVGFIPTTFDCNTAATFVIDLQPDIHNSFIEFNRLHFKLVKGGNTYRSNYVEFESDNTATQQLEWGGSLPSGTYEMRGILKNIQLTSTCADSVYRIENKHLGNIDITEFSNPQKVMEIEYFCQDSDTDAVDRYGVFLSSMKTEEYMDIAFNIANTRCNVDIYQTDLPDSLILATDEAIRRYIADHKQFDNEMFLCGIKGFRDYQGNFIAYLIGATWMDTITFVPTCSTGSLVAVKACIDVVEDKYEIDYNEFVTATTIHELGWQRGIKPSDWHDSEFCIMNVGLVVDTTEVPFNRYSNPHFCTSCINKIKNINW